MNTEDRQDHIDDYLRGRSPDPASFERELNQDPQLQQQMEATRLALDALTAGEDQKIKERLRKLETGLHSAPTNKPGAKIVPLRPRRRRGWLTYAAAAALLLFLAGYLLLRPANLTGPQLAAETFTPYDNIAYTITKGGTDRDNRGTAYSAYEAGDYAGAAAAFRALTDDRPADRFYLGQSLLAQQEYTEALPIFRNLAARSDFNLSQEAAYYEALTLVGLDRQEEAIDLLKAIGNDDAHPLHDEAVDLLVSL